jgi:serine/threonine protein kinase
MQPFIYQQAQQNYSPNPLGPVIHTFRHRPKPTYRRSTQPTQPEPGFTTSLTPDLHEIPNEIKSSYTNLKKIGAGAYACVYRVTNTKDHQHYVLKCMAIEPMRSRNLLAYLELELKIQKSISHPHIVPCYSVKRSLQHAYLIMEYCALGNLRQHTSKSSSSWAGHLFKQLVSAVGFLHNDSCIIHRDLKLENFLLYSTHLLKLTDFGWASTFIPNKPCDLAGTVTHMAPETLARKPQGPPADVWSLGVSLHEFITKDLRYPNRQDRHLPKCLIKLFERTFQTSEAHRITLPEVYTLLDALPPYIPS